MVLIIADHSPGTQILSRRPDGGNTNLGISQLVSDDIRCFMSILLSPDVAGIPEFSITVINP